MECVPNFSEGRDADVLRALREAITALPGVVLLDVHADPSHHRSVFTFVGDPAGVGEAAFHATRIAAARIDLRRHRGEHPRMGAADVVPFVPLGGMSMADCVALAVRLGVRIGDELAIPVFLYGQAARHPQRAELPAIRGRGFEELAARIGREPATLPDFGPPRLHPTAGATAVGAREVLVAFNITLDTDDVALARRIAGEIRASSGGMPAVQAKGFLVARRAQVSLNLLDVDRTPPARVVEAVRVLAAAAGVGILQSEIVGLIPERATAGWEDWRLGEPIDGKVLERRIQEAR